MLDFVELQAEWRDTLKRTNYFERPDSAPPKLFGERPNCSTLASLVVDISNLSGIDVRRLTGPQRKQPLTHWRQLGYYAGMRDLCKTSGQVGKVFSRDHSTILDGARRFHELMDRDPEWLDRYEKIARDLV